MRIIGKPFITSGYNIVLTGKLIKDATISTVKGKNGAEYELFRAAMQIVDTHGKKAPNENLISVEMWGSPVRNLIPWPKGTVLTVYGEMVTDEYWTKQRGEKSYKVMAEKIDAQINYRAFGLYQQTVAEEEKRHERQESHGVEAGGGYDPGF